MIPRSCTEGLISTKLHDVLHKAVYKALRGGDITVVVGDADTQESAGKCVENYIKTWRDDVKKKFNGRRVMFLPGGGGGGKKNLFSWSFLSFTSAKMSGFLRIEIADDDHKHAVFLDPKIRKED